MTVKQRVSRDQGRRSSADHPEPSQRDQTGLLSEAFLSAAAQNRKLLLSYQGLAAHRHPLRQTRSKFPCRRDPHRRTLLDQAVSPDPSLPDLAVVVGENVIGRFPRKRLFPFGDRLGGGIEHADAIGAILGKP